MTDLALWNRWLRNRDAVALQEIFERHGAMVFATCRRILNNSSEAEDVAQDCFEVLLTEHGEGPNRNMGAWLHAVAVNRSKNVIRTRQRQRNRETDFSAQVETSNDAQFPDIESALDEAIHELPESNRAAIVGCFLEGKTRAAVAKEQGVSRRTITTRVKEGVQLLREGLEQRGLVVATASLTAFLDSIAIHAVPTTLTTALGKLALNHVMVHPGATAAASASAGMAFGAKSIVALITVAILLGFVVSSQFYSSDGDTNPDVDVVATGSEATTQPAIDSLPYLAVNGNPGLREEIVEQIEDGSNLWISGKVVDTDGNPVPRARVDAEWWFQTISVVADDDGQFEMEIPVARWSENEIRFSWQVPNVKRFFFSGTRKGNSLEGELLDYTGRSTGFAGGKRSTNVSGEEGPETWRFLRYENYSAVESELTLVLEENELAGGALRDGEKTIELIDVQRPETVLLRAEGTTLESSEITVRLTDGDIDDVELVAHIPVGRLAGIVVDRHGVPMAGCRVLAHLNTREQAGTVTDENGQFATAGLIAGDYDLYLQPDGLTYSQKLEPKISIKPGESKGKMRLVWKPSRVFSGRVRDTASDPIEGAQIRIMMKHRSQLGSVRSAEEGIPQWVLMSRSEFHLANHFDAATDQDGEFEMGGFHEEVKELSQWNITHDEYVNQVKVGSIPLDTILDITLQRRPTIEGKIVDATTGQPLDMFAVRAWQSNEYDELYKENMGSSGRFKRAPGGTFSIRPAAVGRVTVAAAAPGYTTAAQKIDGIAEGGIVPEITFFLEPESGSFTGVVVDRGGDPIPDAAIFRGYVSEFKSRGITRSGSDGTFEFLGATRDDDVVSAYKKGYAVGWAGKIDSEFRIVLSPGGRLEGTITIDGVPAAKRSGAVLVHFPGKQMSADMQGTIGENGFYSVRTVVPPGEMDLEVILPHPHQGVGHWLEYTTTITDGETNILNIDDRTYPGHVEGVVSAAGKPVKEAHVRLWIDGPDGMRSIYRMKTDGEGRFALAGVPTGSVNVRVTNVLTVENEVVEASEFQMVVSEGKPTIRNIEL